MTEIWLASQTWDGLFFHLTVKWKYIYHSNCQFHWVSVSCNNNRPTAIFTEKQLPAKTFVSSFVVSLVVGLTDGRSFSIFLFLNAGIEKLRKHLQSCCSYCPLFFFFFGFSPCLHYDKSNARTCDLDNKIPTARCLI